MAMKDSASVLSKASSELLSNETTSSDGKPATSDDITSVTEHSREELAKEETKSVNKFKFAVCGMLFCTSVLVVSFTLFFFLDQEHREFETAFYGFARTVSDASHFHGRNIIEAFESASDSITSSAISTHQKWPFVTIPHVEIRFEHSRVSSFTEVVGFCPFVTPNQRASWEKYSVVNQGWIKESLRAYNDNDDNNDDDDGKSQPAPYLIQEQIHVVENGQGKEDKSGGPLFAPVWQISPPPFDSYLVNFNLLSDPHYANLVEGMKASDHHVISGISYDRKIYDHVLHIDAHEKFHSNHHFNMSFTAEDHPHSTLLFPVYDSYEDDRALVGLLKGLMPWDAFLIDLLPPGINGIICVIENTCGDVFSYEIDGPEAFYIGWGDHHEPEFHWNRVEVQFLEFDGLVNNTLTQGQCHYSMFIYPSTKFRESYDSPRPEMFTSVIALIFCGTFLIFLAFLHFVNQRQRKVLLTAERTGAIVSSLFPDNVRDRIMKDIDEQVQMATDKGRKSLYFKEAPKHKLKSLLTDEFANGNKEELSIFESVFGTKPIADLFPEATVFFADIVGFTSWSSEREPSQVFQLLETLYHSFDIIAKRRRVFKVETVGDCYVAVAGLPAPRKDHAVVMARFASDCADSIHDLVEKLEVTLGPGTADLSMRIGLHSGQVTAGVLRGQKSRFQLFGDTVNVAARMESTGMKGRVHISQETANLLLAAGKSKWITPRDGKVMVKGKGQLQTFWLDMNKCEEACSSIKSGSSGHEAGVNLETLNIVLQPRWDQPSLRENANSVASGLSDKIKRLVDWNVDQLIRLLKQVIARRNALQRVSAAPFSQPALPDLKLEGSGTVLEEVKEVITLPNFDAKSFKSIENPDTIELCPDVVLQLHDYVLTIATLYRGNPFHNFEHASHVTMSVCKLLSRIVAPEDVNYHGGSTYSSDDEDASDATDKFASALHDHTYGITSDPLTQFSVAFAALIHDVDHRGVPNNQLIQEETHLAAKYKNKSVAEQNSVDIAWKLLMEDKYSALRGAMFTEKSQARRFRQLVVNCVMATDIVDKELKELRNARWEKAFSSNTYPKDPDEDRNRKATIVIEHLIQASDIAHTMQHWQVYRKWNEHFFNEMYVAFKSGRSTTDPSIYWYKGEIGFFDFYIIPLAKKLKDCGVFGVSSDEYLNYARANRDEWRSKGEGIVQEMLQKIDDNSLKG